MRPTRAHKSRGLIRRLHRTCRAEGLAEADYADSNLGGSGNANAHYMQAAHGAESVILIQYGDPALAKLVHNYKIGCPNLPD